MIDRERTPGELREEFSVLGSTGNVRNSIAHDFFVDMLLLNVAITQVYTVVIGHRPSCSCEHN
jgi:hypothetical protein